MAKISPTNRPISAASGGQVRPGVEWVHITPEMTGYDFEVWQNPYTKEISWTKPTTLAVPPSYTPNWQASSGTPGLNTTGLPDSVYESRMTAGDYLALGFTKDEASVLGNPNSTQQQRKAATASAWERNPHKGSGSWLGLADLDWKAIIAGTAAVVGGGLAYGALAGGAGAGAGMFEGAGAGSEFGYGAASTGGAIPAATGGSAADLLTAEGSTFGQPATTTGATAGTGALSSPSLPTAAPATTSGAIPSADAAAKAAKLKALGLTDAQVAAIAKTDALTAAGLTPSQIAAVTSTPGMFEKLLSGGATAADIAKLGISAAAVGALASEDPDHTTTTKIEYPDWYNAGSKSALALADKYAALGPNSVAPLSANENQAIKLAQTSAGDWRPLMDKSVSTLDAALPYYTKAGKTADTVSSYLNRSGALADEAAGGIPSIDLSAYMNPYLDNVLTPIARRNEIAKAAALNDIKAKAGMRGAFGGSRSTLLESQTSEAADRNLNEAEANIRSGAFTTGLTAAQADLQRKLAASGQFGALGNVANNTSTAYTNIGRSLTDTAGGYKTDAGALGVLTDADIARLTSTGGLARGVEQAKLNAPLTAIGGYANALRGNPGSTTTAVAPEASKTGQITGALTALYGANKAGLF